MIEGAKGLNKDFSAFCVKNGIDEAKAGALMGITFKNLQLHPEGSPKGEFLLCAAVHVDDGEVHETVDNVKSGYVIAGRRHSDCYLTIEHIAGHDELLNLHRLSTQGFITSTNRYVSRKEGFQIAKLRGQLQFGADVSDMGEDSILISENLY